MQKRFPAQKAAAVNTGGCLRRSRRKREEQPAAVRAAVADLASNKDLSRFIL